MQVNDELNFCVKWNVLVCLHYMNLLTREVNSSGVVCILENLEA
jgi:hypothetical protein